MIIIGLSGTGGSGKDTVGHLLASDFNFLFVSVSDLLRQEATKRGEPIERAVLKSISEEWRRDYGLGVLVDKALKHFHEQGRGKQGLALASLRNTGEADRVHKLGGKVIWLDADPRLRYDRIHTRLRSPEDMKTYEQFLAEEQAEMERAEGADSTTLNMGAIKDLADFTFINNSSDIDEFKLNAKTFIEANLLS